LDEIGGFPTLTVTEDIHTSLKMHKAGYKTTYINESIAYGIAASDLTEYYKTRHRWAHGNLHTLKHEKILTCKGLTWQQRFSYLSL
jgi:cellulose synthase (UDP-forming)